MAGLLVLLVAVMPAASASAKVSTSVRMTPIGALLAKLKDPAAISEAGFGYAVSVSGTIAIVGAPAVPEGHGTPPAGAAYIYVKGASGWPNTPTIQLSDPASGGNGDLFGYSVALSGKTAVVAAPGSGMAYIYVKGASGWPTTPTTTLTEPEASGEFGYSVAVQGTTAVVGAPGTRPGGAAYIYVKAASGWPTTPNIKLADPAAKNADAFGYSVAVSGKTAVVGAWGTNSTRGAAYIYVKGASDWPTTPTTTLTDPEASERDEFGVSVAVSAKAAVVGAQGDSLGGAYIYVKGTSGWPTTPTTTLTVPGARAHDLFGGSVSVSGETAVVGAENGGKSRVGAAYIYVNGTSGWPTTPTTALTDPAAKPGSFGFSVAVSGKTSVVGAPAASLAGVAYIYKA
jgi:hypothetical protein